MTEPMTPDQALDIFDGLVERLPGGLAGEVRARALSVLRELVDGAPEIECPACSTRIRARMADRQDAPDLLDYAQVAGERDALRRERDDWRSAAESASGPLARFREIERTASVLLDELDSMSPGAAADERAHARRDLRNALRTRPAGQLGIRP
jgi:hypothetical protein